MRGMCDCQEKIDEQQKQIAELYTDLYAIFEHVHAMTAEAGGIKTRWDKHLQARYDLHIQRKRLLDKSKGFTPE